MNAHARLCGWMCACVYLFAYLSLSTLIVRSLFNQIFRVNIKNEHKKVDIYRNIVISIYYELMTTIFCK